MDQLEHNQVINLNRYLQKLFSHLRHIGCHLDKMHEYYNLENTLNKVQTICLERDDTNIRKFTLSIKKQYREYDLLKNNIINLPRDVNNHIYSFLFESKQAKYSIVLPTDYPFHPPIWTTLEYKENGVKTYKQDPEMFCGEDWSPSFKLDLEILAHYVAF